MIQLSAILATLLVLGVTAAQEIPQCGSCQSGNDASCESETSYYNCFNGKKIGLSECKTGFVCSNDVNICVDKTQISSTILNVCGADGNGGGCGVCTTGNKYTCVSKRQAGRCIDNKVSAVIDCEPDEICVVKAQSIEGSVCVPQCAADYLTMNATCTSDNYTPTTLAPSTTPSTDARETVCKTASSGVTALFFYAYYDATCTTAVYCQRNSATSNDWVTLFKSCQSPTPYFDTRLKSCVATKPASCTTV